MSELTTCNYCTLLDIRRDAKKSGMQVTTIPSEHGGVDICVHPKDVKISTQADRDKYFRCWFMEVSSSCVC